MLKRSIGIAILSICKPEFFQSFRAILRCFRKCTETFLNTNCDRNFKIKNQTKNSLEFFRLGFSRKPLVISPISLSYTLLTKNIAVRLRLLFLQVFKTSDEINLVVHFVPLGSRIISYTWFQVEFRWEQLLKFFKINLLKNFVGLIFGLVSSFRLIYFASFLNEFSIGGSLKTEHFDIFNNSGTAVEQCEQLRNLLWLS